MSKFQPKPEGVSTPRRSTFLDKEIGQRIKALRKQRGLSQSRLAQAIGVTFQQVQKYESGKNRLSVGMLVEISQALQCSVQVLLSAEETGVLSKAEYSVLSRWRNLPSEKHREIVHTLLGWL
ncbi:MAG: helix-turn-helix domain-containing protein [Alphaproteobacteria bacterium]|nr:helix-turn-helix domain-containing protein [Alphaproteobacteria bacterium]